MKTTILLPLFFFVLLLFMGCSNDDGPRAIDNLPPELFSLISVNDGAVNVDVNPTFVWEPTIDPEGEDITYDLYVDTMDNPQNLVAENIASTTHTLSNRLSLNTEYHWKVVAKDEKGNQTESENSFGFSTRGITTGTLVTNAAAFGTRQDHATVVFNDRLWVIGGHNGFVYKNDVWYSSDGANWTQATPNAGFSIRSNHASVVYDDKIWVIGGGLGSTDYNDVWYSNDGVTWTQATINAAFSKRSNLESVVFEDKMWVIGGHGDDWYRDVWNSTDGENWTQATGDVGYVDRIGFGAVVFDQKFWITGGGNPGGYYNEVWSSPNGTSWSMTPAAFDERAFHSSAVFDDKIWVINGLDSGDYILDDVWYSKDGTTWTKAFDHAAFQERMGFTATVFKGKLWIIGGYTFNGSSQLLSDVWYME
jgi:hypothetical protein